MNTQCTCDIPRPGIMGQFNPPAWICGICGMNVTNRVEANETPLPAIDANLSLQYCICTYGANGFEVQRNHARAAKFNTHTNRRLNWHEAVQWAKTHPEQSF